MQNNNIYLTPNIYLDPESDVYNSNESETDITQTNGFMSIDTLYKKTSDYEINKINKTLENLEIEFNRYIQDVFDLWNTTFKPFIESADCFILNSVSDDTHNNFFNFMCDQKTYKLMIIAKKRLIARREYLIKNSTIKL
jgi:hypothetical protein